MLLHWQRFCGPAWCRHILVKQFRNTMYRLALSSPHFGQHGPAKNQIAFGRHFG
jgi:hypothetical protein